MTADERRLLELLAASDGGATDALLLAHGFPLKGILGVIGAKLATAQVERVFAANKPDDVTRMRIIEAGWRALANQDGKVVRPGSTAQFSAGLLLYLMSRISICRRR
jgi:hypothetical protein